MHRRGDGRDRRLRVRGRVDRVAGDAQSAGVDDVRRTARLMVTCELACVLPPPMNTEMLLLYWLAVVPPPPLASPMLAAWRLISPSSVWNSLFSVARLPENVPEADCVASCCS